MVATPALAQGPPPAGSHPAHHAQPRTPCTPAPAAPASLTPPRPATPTTHHPPHTAVPAAPIAHRPAAARPPSGCGPPTPAAPLWPGPPAGRTGRTRAPWCGRPRGPSSSTGSLALRTATGTCLQGWSPPCCPRCWWTTLTALSSLTGNPLHPMCLVRVRAGAGGCRRATHPPATRPPQ